MADDLKVLVAEDVDFKMYEYILKSYFPGKFTVVTNGVDLLNEFKKGGYGIVISDKDMPPGINGVDALIQIGQYEEAEGLSNVPKYLMTADDPDNICVPGVIEVLQKPVDINYLVKIIRPHVK